MKGGNFMIGIIQRFILVIIWAFLFISCGDRAPKVNKSGSFDSAKIVCNKKSCEPVQVMVQATGIMNGKLSGYVGQPVQWEFSVTAENASDRDIRLTATQLPYGAKLIGNSSTKLSINYTPLDIPESSTIKPIKVIARDVSRCKFLIPTKEQICEDMSKEIASVETPIEYPWEILENPNLTNTSFTHSQTQPQIGSQAGMTGCLIGFIPGFLSGIMGGNILNGVLNGTQNCINTAVNNLGQP